MKWKKNLVLAILLLGGVTVGSLLATLTQSISYLAWLSYGLSVGIPANDPFVLDLAICRLAFGFELGLNISEIICIIAALLCYRSLASKL